MAGRKWDRQETLAAFALYCQLPFGRLHGRAPEIVALAGRIGRSPDAVAMKCCNLASFDKTHQKRGVKGLSAAAKLDGEVWAEFERDPNALCEEAAQALACFQTPALPQPTPTDGPDEPLVTEREATVRVRLTQRFFRAMILAGYSSRCAVCGLDVAQLVVASHIVPWAVDPQARMNPRNGLCLCGTHDLAFERGVLLISPEYRVSISEARDETRASTAAKEWLFRYAGRQIELPGRWLPDPQRLAERLRLNAGRCASEGVPLSGGA
jgi:putative restriction endonuclease